MLSRFRTWFRWNWRSLLSSSSERVVAAQKISTQRGRTCDGHLPTCCFLQGRFR
jgi:hypothetical protein